VNVSPPLICQDPIFVIGSPRSGTTILANALARHTQFFNLRETIILRDLFGDDKALEAYRFAAARTAQTMVKRFDVTQSEFLACLGIGVNVLFTSRSEGKRWIDKTPQHAVLVDLLAEMFPGAYFIHILRDGRRVVNSMINFHNAPGREKQRQQLGQLRQWDFRNACHTWSQYVDTALDFTARNPTRCLTVNNEELVAHPAEGFRTIFDFIGAPHEDAPAEYFATHQINSSFWPGGRLDAPLTSRFSDPWETWTAEQQQIFNEHAGETMARCALAPASSPPPARAAENKEFTASVPPTTPRPTELAEREFVLLSVARSGSNLLRDYLNQHKQIRCFGEVFKKSFSKEKDWDVFGEMNVDIKRLHAEDLVSFWKVIAEHYKADDVVVGAKLFYYHREGNDIWRYLASSRMPIIHLLREELIDSYLSLKLAETSGIWKQPKAKTTEANYERNVNVDLADFQKYCANIQHYLEQTRSLFKDNPCLNISYSSLISDRENVMAVVYAFLDVPNEPTSPRLVKQRLHNREELITNWDETAKFIESNPGLCTVR
jgi:LPS sulfotransferase NodH